MTDVSDITVKMIQYSKGNLHDINHFMKVFAYAKTIGEAEGLDSDTQKTLEIAALLHDIACPLCRIKYGNTNGKYQEAEGTILAEEFLKDKSIPEEMKKRVIYLVGHHHTYTNVDGKDYQILLEADYLVNADESSYSKENIQNAMEQIFHTKTGSTLLKTIYQI
jgi:Predicted HD superfamily hydrolase